MKPMSSMHMHMQQDGRLTSLRMLQRNKSVKTSPLEPNKAQNCPHTSIAEYVNAGVISLDTPALLWGIETASNFKVEEDARNPLDETNVGESAAAEWANVPRGLNTKCGC